MTTLLKWGAALASAFLCVSPLQATTPTYNYFAPGGALSCSGACTTQTVNLTNSGFLIGPLSTSELPAFSGDCITPGGSGVLTCTKTNGVAFGPAATIATTTGSGSVVLATSPTLVSPSLGTPSSINLSNGTNLPLNALATCAATQILFATSNTVATCSTKLTWSDTTSTLTLGVPGTGTVIATPNAISGNGTALVIRTGNGTGASTGGNITFSGGVGGTTGFGATLTFNAGNGGTTSGGGGRLVFNGGNAGPTGNATGGDVDINGGQGAGNGQAGAFNIVGGQGDPGSNGGGGSVGITGGTGGGTGGVGGSLTLQGGSSLGAQAAGDVLIGGGSASGSGANGRAILIDQNFDNALAVDGVGHISYSVTPPAVSACGTSPSIDAHATDTTGTVTVGSVSAVTCTITFANAYTTWVHCRVSSQSVVTAFSYSYTTTRIVVTATSLVSDKLDYACDGS